MAPLWQGRLIMAPGLCWASGLCWAWAHTSRGWCLGSRSMGTRGELGLSGKVLDTGHPSPSSLGVALDSRASSWPGACVWLLPPVHSEGCPLRCLTGTFVSAFAVLCGARTDLPDRHVCCVFWLNIAAALIQTLTAIVMVGWIMSIFWGMDMVILASE